jgi:uncharacterized protein
VACTPPPSNSFNKSELVINNAINKGIGLMSSFLAHLKGLPRLGFGLGLKETYCQNLLDHQHTVDWADQVAWLEIIPENFMGKGGYSQNILEQLLEAGFSMASHGVNLSIGSVDPLNSVYLDELEALFAIVQPVWFSDHLTFGSVDHQYFNELMPLPFTPEAVAKCVANIQQLQTRFTIPFIIENASYYLAFQDNSAISEAEFLTRVVEGADCGLLLDINNIYVNAQNHGYDALAFLQNIPLERVVEIHIAGHLETPDLIIDTHGEPVRPEVYDLMAWVYPRCPNLKGVLLERDTNLPPFDELLAEFQAVQTVALQANGDYVEMPCPWVAGRRCES